MKGHIFYVRTPQHLADLVMKEASERGRAYSDILLDALEERYVTRTPSAPVPMPEPAPMWNPTTNEAAE